MRWRSSPNGRSFAAPTSTTSSAALRTPVIFDGRNLYDPAHMARAGFSYYAIGRGQASQDEHNYETVRPVILSGGAGTRLWPLSREMYPKQLLALTGKHTMLQETALRLAGIAGAGAPDRRVQRGAPVHGGRADPRAVDRARPRSCSSPSAATPRPRSRSPRCKAQEIDPDAVLMVAPADHVIRDARVFQQAADRGRRARARAASS